MSDGFAEYRHNEMTRREQPFPAKRHNGRRWIYGIATRRDNATVEFVALDGRKQKIIVDIAMVQQVPADELWGEVV